MIKLCYVNVFLNVKRFNESLPDVGQHLGQTITAMPEGEVRKLYEKL